MNNETDAQPGNRRQRAAGIRERHGDKLRFLIVGSIGFAVDGGILLILTSFAGWMPVPARVVGIPVAVSVTWWFNRMWTFKSGRARSMEHQYALYFVVQLAGLAVNFAIFAGLVRLPWFATCPIAALAVASTAAMFATYVLSRYFVFAAPRR